MQILIQGTVIDVYERVPYINKETGETNPITYGLQLLVVEKLSNGATKSDIYDVKLDNKELAKSYKAKKGQNIELECKIYSRSPISLSIA